ncbi:MAG TPA: hypothetical protein VF630_18040, partial [Hymenobacter sp.]
PAFQTDSLRLFRGQLAYLEEKAAVEASKTLANRGSTANSTQAFAAVFASPAHRIDQVALLRARLLDGWLGDWDRHPGQWNWAQSRPDATGTASFAPLPKDRDMVFYRLDDGALGWVVGHVLLRHWVTFGPRFRNASALLSSGHYLDVRGLNALTRAQFKAVALAMQRQLPDTLINRAVRRLPPAAYSLEGPRLTAALQLRRAELPALADGLYRELARKPAVGGTAQAERFEVHRYADSTVVTVQARTSAGSKGFTYRRSFLPAETRLVQLEGLGGDDEFVVENHAAQPVSRPQVRIYGGPGTDALPSAKAGIHTSQGGTRPKKAYDEPPKE